MRFDQARKIVEAGPMTWLGEAARAVLAEADRRDPARIAALEAEVERWRGQSLYHLGRLVYAEQAAEQAVRDRDAALAAVARSEELLRAQVSERDRVAAELARAEVPRLQALEEAVRQVLALPLRTAPARRVQARLRAIVAPFMPPAKP